MTGMLREDDLKIQTSAFDFHRALVANSGLTEESFKSAQTNAKDTFYDIIASLRPWEGKSSAARKEKESTSLRQSWFEAFGVDPNDPAWQENNRRDIEKWKAERNHNRSDAVESDRGRIDRLRRERDAKIQSRKNNRN